MNEIDLKVAKIQMSPTMSRLYKLNSAVDRSTKEDFKKSCATFSIDIIDALDNGRIHFDDDTDKCMLFGLLVLAVDTALDGRLNEAFEKATMQ